MEEHIVKIKSIAKITHDVLHLITEKPLHYNFLPGQATDVSINNSQWKEEKRPFTFTCLPHNPYIEFTIKTYPNHQGVTNQLLQLKEGDEIILHEVFGDISYKGEGLFIAGGAGITPFISIFRHLQSMDSLGNNKLIFANKTRKDIINENEFNNLLGENFINVLSDEIVEGYATGYITGEFLKETGLDISKHVYLCGPPPMMDAMEKILKGLGVHDELIVKEAF